MRLKPFIPILNSQSLTCFKAYDIRGRLGSELDDSIAYRIGRAYGSHLQPKRVVVGADVRPTSESLKAPMAKGLMDAGVDVIDIGLTGTEEVYFAAAHLDVDEGIEVTASHNPIDFNGMKLVGKGAQPISGDSGLRDIQKLTEDNEFAQTVPRGSLSRQSILDEYIQCLLGFVETNNLKPLKLVVNAGNGAAGHVVDALEQAFKKKLSRLNLPKYTTNLTAPFPTAYPIHCCPKTAQQYPMQSSNIRQTWV